MRRFVGLGAVAVLLLLAGCQAPTHAPALPDRPGDGPGMSDTPAPDPSTDVLGWENGVWHDDPIPIDASDGLRVRTATRRARTRHLRTDTSGSNTTTVQSSFGSHGTAGESFPYWLDRYTTDALYGLVVGTVLSVLALFATPVPDPSVPWATLPRSVRLPVHQPRIEHWPVAYTVGTWQPMSADESRHR